MDACLFTFHHLRFLCHDIPNTIDFYQTLGLSVYSKTDSVTHNAQGQMVTKTTIIFTYPQKTKPFYLIFEYLPSHSAFEANNIQKEMIVLAERPFLDPSNEYLVFYVQHIEKITKLLAAKKFKLVVPVVQKDDLKLSILLDANGMEVRLIEMSNAHLNELCHPSDWVSKFGYYVLPTLDMRRSVHWYHDLFTFERAKIMEEEKNTIAMRRYRKAMKRQETKAEMVAGGEEDIDPGLYEEWSKSNHLDNSILQKLRIGGKSSSILTQASLNSTAEGFKMVDYEEYKVGLTRNVHVWMGNDERRGAMTLCFCEKMDGSKIPKLETLLQFRKDSRLKGIGFLIKDLDKSIDRLKFLHKELKWDPEGRQYMQDMGAYQRLRDPITQTWIELYSQYKDYMELSPLKSEVPHSSGWDLGPTRNLKGNEKHIPFVLNHGPAQQAIHHYHLKNLAIHLSSDAIETVHPERKEAIQKLPAPPPVQSAKARVTMSKAKKNVPVSPIRKADKPKSKSTFM